METATMEPDLEILTHDSHGQAFIPGTEPKVIPELAAKTQELHEVRLMMASCNRREKKIKGEIANLVTKYADTLKMDNYSIRRYWAGDLLLEFSSVVRDVIKTRVGDEKTKRALDDLDAAFQSDDVTGAQQLLILGALEDATMALTLSEICDDTGMTRKEVVDCLQQMQPDLVRQVRRHVPGSDKPQYLWKSTRTDYPEAD